MLPKTIRIETKTGLARDMPAGLSSIPVHSEAPVTKDRYFLYEGSCYFYDANAKNISRLAVDDVIGVIQDGDSASIFTKESVYMRSHILVRLEERKMVDYYTSERAIFYYADDAINILRYHYAPIVIPVVCKGKGKMEKKYCIEKGRVLEVPESFDMEGHVHSFKAYFSRYKTRYVISLYDGTSLEISVRFESASYSNFGDMTYYDISFSKNDPETRRAVFRAVYPIPLLPCSEMDCLADIETHPQIFTPPERLLQKSSRK